MNIDSQDRHPRPGSARDDRFDEAMRGLHRSALANVSPQVRRRLKPAAPPQGGTAWRFGHWRLPGPLMAGAGAAALAIALGSALWPVAEEATPASGASPVAVAEDSAGVLEQDPDFYAWLASDDAALVAVE